MTFISVDQEEEKVKKKEKWGNPFEIGRDGTREEVIAKYREYILNKPELLEQIPLELKGKTLGCFCKPKACHGDVLVYIAVLHVFIG